ncbi:MAG: transporter [Rhodospirillales bacterium]|nr:transporter [Rhodospirillales bacterium]
MNMRMSRRCTGLLLLAGLGGCDLAPPYDVPKTREVAHFATPPVQAASAVDLQQWAVAHPSDDAIGGAWWTMYDDAVLADLAKRVDAANQDLAASAARLAQARAAVRYARADESPQLTANGQVTRQRQSQNRPNRLATASNNFSDDTLGLDLSYEIDLWGRVKNEVSASKRSAQASAADHAATTLSLQAELASDYFTLRGADAELRLLQDTIQVYQRALELTQKRYSGGAGTEADVAQAQAQLESARTAATDAQLRRTQTEHAIAVLVGEPASIFHLAATNATNRVPVVDPGLPSTLLERRPDIASAERRVAAANAEIGVARAAYYPRLSLGALFGVESKSAGSLLSAPSRFWSIGPQLAGTLFDGGRITADVDRTSSVRDEAAATYRSTVLGAFRDVEDQMTALRQLEQEAKTQAATVDAALRALRQTEARYRGGLVTFLEVVVLQNTALQAQRDALTIETRRLTSSVLLARALGGGWSGVNRAV